MKELRKALHVTLTLNVDRINVGSELVGRSSSHDEKHRTSVNRQSVVPIDRK